jgi:osmotically-inducible protein OsmY
MRTINVLAGVSCSLMLSACAGFAELRQCGFDGCGTDPRIAAEVRNELTQRRSIGPPGYVYVQSLGGVVYLTGHVLTDTERNAAVSIARNTRGVQRVVDMVNVRADEGA